MCSSCKRPQHIDATYTELYGKYTKLYILYMENKLNYMGKN